MGIEILVGASLLATAAGGVTSFIGQQKQAEANERIAALEKQRLEQQKKQMELEYRRRQMEMLRQQQRARAMSLATTTSQGAFFGSGAQGALGQISGQGYTQLLGLDQNYAIGQNMYGINMGISDARMSAAQGQTLAGIGSGLSSLGGSLMKGVPAFGRLTGSNVGYSDNYYGY